MIPLSLKLVEQEVQPEGKRKKVRVLSLTAPYSLTEIQKYAQIPPGRVLLLPPPDTEAPDDLFPQEILEQGIPGIDEELLQVWEDVKGKMSNLTLKEAQIAKWFKDHYQIEASLKDFESSFPLDKFTKEQLSRFLISLTAYEEKVRQRKLLQG